jgi:hypothetical protein
LLSNYTLSPRKKITLEFLFFIRWLSSPFLGSCSHSLILLSSMFNAIYQYIEFTHRISSR